MISTCYTSLAGSSKIFKNTLGPPDSHSPHWWATTSWRFFFPFFYTRTTKIQQVAAAQRSIIWQQIQFAFVPSMWQENPWWRSPVSCSWSPSTSSSTRWHLHLSFDGLGSTGTTDIRSWFLIFLAELISFNQNNIISSISWRLFQDPPLLMICLLPLDPIKGKCNTLPLQMTGSTFPALQCPIFHRPLSIMQ